MGFCELLNKNSIELVYPIIYINKRSTLKKWDENERVTNKRH